MRVLILLLFLLFASYSYSQTGYNNKKINENWPLIKVKDWGQMSMTIVDEIWNNSEREIITQIGKVEYRKVRENYSWQSIPAEMSNFAGGKKKDKNTYHEKMNKLKVMYKIATYTSSFQGKDWGKYVILKVPYAGNEDWDTNVKWDVVYFIFTEGAVEEINEKD